MKKRTFYILAISLSILLRFQGLFHDLWLDEIVAFQLVFKLSSPVQIFTRLFHDGNHHLISLYIYLMGTDIPCVWIKYRFLSFVLGIGTVMLSILLLKKIFSSIVPRVIAIMLMATSFPLVVYSSEVRGYSPAIFFAISSLYLLIEYCEKKKLWASILFKISFVLGFLFQAQFVYISLGLFMLYLHHLNKRSIRGKQMFYEIFNLFFLPVAIVLAVYIPFITHLEIGGWPRNSISDVITRFSSFICGNPGYSPFAYILAILLIFTLINEIRFLLKKNLDLGVFVLGISILPIVVLVLRLFQIYFIFARYFVILAPFYIILISHALYRIWDKGGWRKICSLIIIILILAGNVKRDINFLTGGRGQYLKALSYIYRTTDSSEITISSDHDFRNSTILKFYYAFIPKDKKVSYISSAGALDREMEWYITHSFERRPQIPLSLSFNNTSYILKKSYLFNGDISGCHWYIYRRKQAKDNLIPL